MRTTKPYFLFTLLIVVTLGLLFYVWWRQNVKTIEIPASASPTAEAQKETLIVIYQTNVKRTIDNFNSYQVALKADKDEYLNLTRETRNELLALNVPNGWQEFHLQLTVALNLIERGLMGEPIKLTQGENGLRALITINNWLK